MKMKEYGGMSQLDREFRNAFDEGERWAESARREADTSIDPTVSAAIAQAHALLAMAAAVKSLAEATRGDR